MTPTIGYEQILPVELQQLIVSYVPNLQSIRRVSKLQYDIARRVVRQRHRQWMHYHGFDAYHAASCLISSYRPSSHTVPLARLQFTLEECGGLTDLQWNRLYVL